MPSTRIDKSSAACAPELSDPLFAEVVGSPVEWLRDHHVDEPEWHGDVHEYCHRDATVTEHWFVVEGEPFYPCRKDASVSTPELAVRRMLARLGAAVEAR